MGIFNMCFLKPSPNSVQNFNFICIFFQSNPNSPILFSSLDHLLQLCAFLILFHLTWMRFSRSIHLLMFLSLETLMSIIRTGLPILVELIDLVNSVIIFLSQMILFRWLTFLLRSQTMILIVLHFWIYFFLLTLVFVLQWLSLHWKILIMLLFQFPVTFHQTHNGMSHFVAELYSSNTPSPPFKGDAGGCIFSLSPSEGGI